MACRINCRHSQVRLLIVQHAGKFGKGGRAIVIQMQENRRKKIVQFMARAAEVRCEPPALDSLVLPSSRKKKGFPSICATPSACWSNAACRYFRVSFLSPSWAQVSASEKGE